MFLRNSWSLRQIDWLPEDVMEDKNIQFLSKMVQFLEVGSIQSIIKTANKKLWLGEDKRSVPEFLLKELLFSFYVSKKGEFVISSFPIVFETYDSEDEITHFKNISFSLYPNVALIYSNNEKIKECRNRIILIPEKK